MLQYLLFLEHPGLESAPDLLDLLLSKTALGFVLARFGAIDSADELLARAELLEEVGALFLLALVVALPVVVLRLLELQPPELSLSLLLLLEHVLVGQDEGVPDSQASLVAPIRTLYWASEPGYAALRLALQRWNLRDGLGLEYGVSEAAL